MLNEHTLKIKQFFRKLIITNKCYVKKLHIWLFGLIFENYANFFGWQLPLMFLWRKIFGFCWLLSSNMFDLISDCQDDEHPQNFLIFTKIAVFSTQFTQIWRRMLLCRNSFGPKIWLWWASQIFIFARILGKLKEREGNLMRKINLMVH